MPIEADPYQIRQIFWNICLNSIQAMPKGGEITIRVRMNKESELLDKKAEAISLGNPFAAPRDWLIVTIEDKGCGISSEKIEKIMDPFVSFRDDGIGLGLSIVSQLVKLHRGYVKVTSIEGKGTTFYLLFPCIVKEKHIAH